MSDPTRLITSSTPLSPEKKLMHGRMLSDLGERSSYRQSKCWMHDASGCTGRPITFVSEVGFDFKDLSSESRVAMLSSKDIPGPVPGFCLACASSGPPLLAEAVYNTRRETRFGLRLNRWFMRFADGTSTVGSCEPFALHRAKFTYSDRATS